MLDSKPVYTMPVYQARKKKTVPGATPAKEDEPVEVPTVEKIKTPESENQKKLKNINKKLKQIQEIKTKIQDGDKVELTQLKKLESEDGLIKELELLSL